MFYLYRGLCHPTSEGQSSEQAGLPWRQNIRSALQILTTIRVNRQSIFCLNSEVCSPQQRGHTTDNAMINGSMPHLHVQLPWKLHITIEVMSAVYTALLKAYG